MGNKDALAARLKRIGDQESFELTSLNEPSMCGGGLAPIEVVQISKLPKTFTHAANCDEKYRCGRPSSLCCPCKGRVRSCRPVTLHDQTDQQPRELAPAPC